MSVGEKLKELREGLGYNKREIAEKLDMPYTTYNNYETDNRDVSSEILRKIARFYGVTIDFILENDLDGGTSPHSDDVDEYLEYLHKRPEMKMLFSASKNVTKEQLEQVVKMIESFKPKDYEDGC